ncbi:MAG: hypothetical protein H0V11_02920 [Actinobacteria bacterium]|nr:hypothetical protein [Actinomycetota bacterium]
MRPAVGNILSGLALAAVTGSMLVPERFLGPEDAAVPGLALEVPAERMVVRAATFRPQRVQHAAPVTRRPLVVVARRAPVPLVPVAVAISGRVPVGPPVAPPPPVQVPVGPPVAPPPPPPPPVQTVVPNPPPPLETAAPLPVTPIEPPAIGVASVSGKTDKGKGDRKDKGKAGKKDKGSDKPRKEKKHKKWDDDKYDAEKERGEEGEHSDDDD